MHNAGGRFQCIAQEESLNAQRRLLLIAMHSCPEYAHMYEAKGLAGQQ